MNALKNLDLYTVLILLSLVLLPVCGWWCVRTNETILLSEKAIAEATRSNGLIEQIGQLQKKIEVVNQSRGGLDLNKPGPYFESQIMAAGKGVGVTDFGIEGPKETVISIPGGKQRAADYVVDVQWKRKDQPLKLDFIEALLWNCESGAGQSGATNLQSIWKLSNLEIVNMTDEKALMQYNEPPPELQDLWQIRVLKFTRREPRK